MNQSDDKQLVTRLFAQNNHRLTREFKLERSSIDANKRTVSLSFSSETPVLRDFGLEVLDHSEGAVNLARLQTGGALLVDHDHTKHVGAIEQVTVSNRRGAALVRFGKSALAEEIFNDVLDGIRTSVSIGYLINDAVREQGPDGGDIYRVTKWEPYEISLVSVPADSSVGVGRSLGENMETGKNTHQGPVAGGQDELARVREIDRLGKKYGMESEAERAIDSGLSLQDFQRSLQNNLNSNQRSEIRSGNTIDPAGSIPGIENFSIAKVIRRLAGDTDVDCGFETEVSQELARTTGKRTVRGLLIPTQALRSVITGAENKEHLIGVQHMHGEFIDVLRNRSVLMRLNPTVLSGLTADISIPRQNMEGSATWLDLDGTNAIPVSAQRFDSVKMEMKTLAGLSTFSHRMLKQATPGIEQLIRQDLAAVLATELDRAAIAGTGADGQPTGIIKTTGISAGTYAGWPTFADVVGMEGLIASSSADVAGMAYVTTPALASIMKCTPKEAGTASYIWEGGQPGEGIVNTYRAMYSATVPAEHIIFGNWANLIVGQWGAIELDVDDKGDNFAKGNVRVRAITDVDIGCRHPESFAVLTKAA